MKLAFYVIGISWLTIELGLYVQSLTRLTDNILFWPWWVTTISLAAFIIETYGPNWDS